MLRYVNIRKDDIKTMKLKDIIRLDNPESYRLHLAKKSNGSAPLDDYLDSFAHWENWQKWYTGRDRFPVKYVISFMDFYPKPGSALFGGIFEVLNRNWDNAENNPAEFYDVKLTEDYKELIGRLRISTPCTGMQTVMKLENYYDGLEVLEIFEAPYRQRNFPGYENIDCAFSEIRRVISSNIPDWKAALSSVKGVYMLTDLNNGKRYIGSAYGYGGIWGRWHNYINFFHGGNSELIKLCENHGEEYMNNFKFTLLEIHPASAFDEYIIERENFWKGVMLSRDEKYGYNDN